MQSRPNFEIDIIKNNTTLSLTCMYLMDAPAEGEYGTNKFTYINNNFFFLLIYLNFNNFCI